MSASNPAAMQAKLDELFAPANRGDAPGIVAGIAQHGKTIYRRAFGLASVELGVANDVTTRMRIGSTTKHFTCLALLLLAEEGLVNVDDGVRTYVPELPKPASEPTLRQLMSHTGGIRDYVDLAFLAHGMHAPPAGSALASQVRQHDVNFPPGERIVYCNGGYHLLSVVIARVSGKSYEAFLQERIFEPLGMIDTASYPNDLDLHDRQASQHVPLEGGGWRRGIFPTEELTGEGAIVSTVDDMLRWVAHLRGPKSIGSDATWAQMLTPAELSNGRVSPYCLGLMRSTYRGIETVHHGGTVIGGRCQMLTVPSRALDIVILNNGAAQHPGELASGVIDALLGDELQPVAARPKTDEYAALAGARYHSPASGFVVEFGDASGTLGLRLLHNEPIALRGGDGEVHLDFEDLVIGPIEIDLSPYFDDRSAAPEALTIGEAGNFERYVRLEAAAPAAHEVFTMLAGAYESPDLGESAHVLLQNDAVKVRIGGTFGTTLVLEPFSADVFGWSMGDKTLPIRGVLNLDRANGKVTGFRIDMGRTRRLRFVRKA